MAPQLTGTMVVSRPNHPYERSQGAVALVHLYGPRGGEAGHVLIDKTDANAAINRLESFLDRSDNDHLVAFVREHGPLLLEALDSHLYWQVNEDHTRRDSGNILDPLTEDEQHVTDVEAKLRELLGNPVAA